MRKRFCALALCAAVAVHLAAIEVDEQELRVPGSDAIQFENYGGPYAVIESAAAIVGIGTALGREVAADVTAAATVQPGAKYTLVHAVGDPAQDGLDADILLLSETAGVDHIRNLRRIVAGYLEAAYGYMRDDAETLATFVTVYNAVYRSQLAVFAEKYKDSVLAYLSEADVGLSTNWQDWAGHTQLVIPLNDVTSTDAAVDTTTISDENVVEALREEADKGIAEREALADIKEREATDAAEKAQTAQQEAAQQRKDGDKAGAAQSAQESTAQQQIADRKTAEVKNDRQTIAKDKETIASAAPGTERSLTGLFVADAAKGLYRLVTVDGDTGAVIRRSPVTQIRGTTVYGVSGVTVTQEDGTRVTFPELYLAVCGVNGGKSAVKLCLLDTERLELQKQSDETLAEGTSLVPYNGVFFAVVQQGKECFAAAFDKNLTMTQKSALAVKPTTPFNITERGILVTDANGNPRLLDLRDLSTLWTSAATDAK